MSPAFVRFTLACTALVLGVACSLKSAYGQSDHIQPQIRAGNVKSRGVNLGSWLVVEQWMTPTADIWDQLDGKYEGTGEYTVITKSEDPDTIRSHLAYHQSTFITEEDIKQISEAGLNTVRVPIGYWIANFDNYDPSNEGQEKVYPGTSLFYLDALICNWAKKYNVAVMLSMHGAKSSQNGADHSSPIVPGTAYWSSSEYNVNATLDSIKWLAARYQNQPAFLGIGLMNEPNGVDEPTLYSYYQHAYESIRATGNDCILILSPMLWKQDSRSLTDIMVGPDYTNLWIDWHIYFAFDFVNEDATTLLTKSLRTDRAGDIREWNALPSHNSLYFGEWSFATSGQFNYGDDGFYEFAESLIDALDQGEAGWAFWSWRVYGDENDMNPWSLRSMLRDPVIADLVAGKQW